MSAVKETGVTLSDGTAISDLVPRSGERRVAARVMSDPEIYRLELEKIFDQTWIFVAHESEIPGDGDFVTRHIGEDPVIVVRDLDGDISVLLNSCSHRGPKVCLADRGNSATFTCPYHGWVYENTGELVGILGEKLIYRNGIEKSRFGLKKARVGTFQGLVFATWNEEAPALEEHLGPMRAWLEAVLGYSVNGMVVAGPPQRWIIPANWKLGADNFSTDNYHTSVVHATMADAVPGIKMDVASTSSRVHNFTDPVRGHSVAGFIDPGPDMPSFAWLDIAGQIGGIPQNIVEELRTTMPPEAVEMLIRTSAGAGNVWPNLSWIRSGFICAEDEQVQPAVSIRYWQPKGPDKMEAFSWTLVHKDAPEEVKAAASRAMARSFGSSGNFEQDDAEVWINIQRATSGVQGRKRKLMYNAEGTLDPENQLPGDTYKHQISDDNQWHFYARWRDMLDQ